MMCRKIRIIYGVSDKYSYKSMDGYGGGGEQRIYVSGAMCVESEKEKGKCWFEMKYRK